MWDAVDLPEPLSRRHFLKTAGFGLLAMGVPLVWRGRPLELPTGQLGRVAEETIDAFLAPSFGATRVGSLVRDELLQLGAAVVGDRYPEHNRVWYEIDRLGYVHSGAIQPVRNDPQAPLAEIPWTGLLAEVCAPFVDSFLEPDFRSERQYRYYFETTHWVTGVQRDALGRWWYQIEDDKLESPFFARAENFRPIPLAELTPISPTSPPRTSGLRSVWGSNGCSASRAAIWCSPPESPPGSRVLTGGTRRRAAGSASAASGRHGTWPKAIWPRATTCPAFPGWPI